MLSTLSKSAANGAGKWYTEVTASGVSYIGFAKDGVSAASQNNWGAYDRIAWYTYSSNCGGGCICCTDPRPAYGRPGWSDGDNIGIALDLDASAEYPKGTAQWYRNGEALGWLTLGTSDSMLPGADFTHGAWRLIFSDFTSGTNAASATINVLPSYPIPSGFQWWAA